MFSFLKKRPRSSEETPGGLHSSMKLFLGDEEEEKEVLGFTTFLICGGKNDRRYHRLIDEVRRDSMNLEAQDFRTQYTYGPTFDNKTLVCPGATTHQWQDKTSGTVWVAVHGFDSICVVTKTADLDLTRVHHDYKYLTIEAVLRIFRKTIISEIEDLATTSNKLCQQFGPTIPKPFGVVSVILPTDNGHEESGHEASSDESEEDEEDEGSSQVSSAEYLSKEDPIARLRKALLKAEKRDRKNQPKIAGYDDKNTVKFLREQMRMDTTRTKAIQGSSSSYDESGATAFLIEKMTAMGMEAFNMDVTIKTAISAFQHLFQKEFKANEIEVTVMGPHYVGPVGEAIYTGLHVKELEMSEIKYHLDTINELRSGCWCNGLYLIERVLGGLALSDTRVLKV